jgi:hypothetical protein
MKARSILGGGGGAFIGVEIRVDFITFLKPLRQVYVGFIVIVCP